MVEAARLSHRYIAGRQLPDKAVDLIDTACGPRRHEQNGMTNRPSHLEDRRAADPSLGDRDRGPILEREAMSGGDHAEIDPVQVQEVDEEIAGLRAELTPLEKRVERRKGSRPRDPQVKGLREKLGAGGAEAGGAGAAAERARGGRRGAGRDPGRTIRCSRSRSIRTGDRRGGGGLDRHPGRPDGPGRDPGGARI
ncbi:MAG: hypothetical protein MPW15_23000 [Candidatus Manganitrophus sp.]|nr:hypothetical protein [Candidatus Manganitrophus sp.]